MRAVNLRARLADQQRLLDRIEWSPWVRHGCTAIAATFGLLAVWDNGRGNQASSSPVASTLPAALLIALSVAPWVVCWAVAWARPRFDPATTHHLGFAIAVLAPLAVLHVGGEVWHIAGLDVRAAQLSLMILLLLVVQTAAHAPVPTVAAVELAVLAIILGRAVQSEAVGLWVVWFVAASVVLVAGLALRASFVSVQSLREAHDELARRAVEDERRRVAREVHDTVAHTLSITMLHLTAARLAVERAPHRAVAALTEAERQGRAGMSDIRRIVHLLRVPDDRPGHDSDAVPRAGTASAAAATAAPAIEPALPTLGELADLLACYREAGLAVTFEGVDGRAGAANVDVASTPASPGDGRVPPAIGLALYRVAQESLTNAAKHGAGDAHVRLSVDGRETALTVRNRYRPSPSEVRPGIGILGMRERVVGLGGDFRAGPLAEAGDGGDGCDGTAAPVAWQVEARIPTGAPP